MKQIITLLLIVSIVFNFTGCGKRDTADSTTDQTTAGIVEEPTASTSENDNETDSNTEAEDDQKHDVVSEDTMLWEKAYKNADIATVVLSSEWSSYIKLGEATVSSTIMTDASALPNYFFDEGDESHLALEETYYVPTFQCVSSTNRDLGNYASLQLHITNTTLKIDDPDSVFDYSILDEIVATCSTNPYEKDLEFISESADWADGIFGIGSMYEHVVNIIGEPHSTNESNSGDGITWITCRYISETAYLTLGFTNYEQDAVESPILTSISWIPVGVCNILHGQDEIEWFENHPLLESVMKESESSEELVDNAE